MAALLGLERLFRWVGFWPHTASVDPADMGTAFGMEMSFDAAEGAGLGEGEGEDHAEDRAAAKADPRHPAE